MVIFFADSRLWLGANLRCLWWKRGTWDGNKERFVQIESVWFVKNVWCLRTEKKGLCK